MPRQLIVNLDGTSETVPYDKPVLTQTEIDARVAAAAAKEAESAEIVSDAAAVKADNAVRTLINARPQQIETYIANNVTNLAQAKEVLTILAKAVSAIGRHQFRNQG